MHLMIDVETLGTRPGSVVTNIGVVAFAMPEADVNVPFIDTGMEIPLNPQEQIDLGFKVDWDTIRWWMAQSREAQALLPKVGFSLEVGLTLLREYVSRWDVEGVWGNGPDFDLTAMNILFENADIACPWKYNKGRDCRTLADVIQYGLSDEVIRPKPAIAHSALSDARAQALWVQRMWGSLPGRSANGSPTAAAEGT